VKVALGTLFVRPLLSCESEEPVAAITANNMLATIRAIRKPLDLRIPNPELWIVPD
jgi:hypothetical protein